MTRAAILVLALLGARPWWAAELLRPGPFPVGFATELLNDPTRAPLPGRPRLVQLALWYPAATVDGRPLTYADYLRCAAADSTAVARAQGPDAAQAYRAFLLGRAVPDSVITSWLSAPMLALRDAAPAGGSFPLVLIAQGNGQSAVDQSVLGEYLASWGYAVATSPSQARITGQPSDEAGVGPAALDQADDLALIRSAAGRRAGVVAARVAVIGHSFGARSALLYAMRDSTVRGIVSLDGGVGTATARASYESTRAFRPDALHVPLLHFYEELDSWMTPDWGTLGKLVNSDVRLVKTTGLHHYHFTALGVASGRFPSIGTATGANGDTERGIAAVLELTRLFLDATLRGDSTALHRLEHDAPVLLR
jgi:dienelactone hydrolase